MKKSIFTLTKIASVLLIALIAFQSCSEDDSITVTAAANDGSLVFQNSTASNYILSAQTASNTAERFVWSAADFGTETAVSYDLQSSISPNFEEVNTLDTSSETNVAVTVGSLLAIATNLGLDNDPLTTNADGSANNSATLYVRVRGYIGNGGANTQELYSNVEALNLTVLETTGDVEIALPMIAVPGAYQGWSPAIAPTLAAAALGETNYEGFVYFDGGEYKFLAPKEDGTFDWGTTDWGDDGTNTGKLVSEDETNCIAPASGYHLVKANTTDLTYSAISTSWGVIGNATPTGWDSDTDLVYDAETGLLSITLMLTEQVPTDNGFKFRANDAWDLNMGDTGADGSLEFSGDNIGVPATGMYKITLDLTNPRAYTYTLEAL